MEKDEAYDIYSREGFVSVNPDGSDRKLIFSIMTGKPSLRKNTLWGTGFISSISATNWPE